MGLSKTEVVNAGDVQVLHQFSANQESGSLKPLSLLKRKSAGVDSMQRASTMQLHGVASAVQNLSTTPVDGVVL